VFSSPVWIHSIDVLDASAATFTGTSLSGTDLIAKNQWNSDSKRPDDKSLKTTWFEEVMSGPDWSAGVTELQIDLTDVSGAIDNIRVSTVPLPAAVWLSRESSIS
jgi:hypothetical protein